MTDARMPRKFYNEYIRGVLIFKYNIYLLYYILIILYKCNLYYIYVGWSVQAFVHLKYVKSLLCFKTKSY